MVAVNVPSRSRLVVVVWVGFDDDRPLPVVVLLHGNGRAPDDWVDGRYGGLELPAALGRGWTETSGPRETRHAERRNGSMSARDARRPLRVPGSGNCKVTIDQ